MALRRVAPLRVSAASGRQRTVRHMSRKDRQHDELLALFARGEMDRAVPLAREHLADFPDDEEVRRALLDAGEAEGVRR